jgi:hypothetical protein
MRRPSGKYGQARAQRLQNGIGHVRNWIDICSKQLTKKAILGVAAWSSRRHLKKKQNVLANHALVANLTD